MICVYKCKNCGDRMKYSIEKHLLTCDTCESSYGIDEYDISNVIYEGELIDDKEIQLVRCPACGASANIKKGSAKGKCVYCGNEMAVFGLGEDKRLPEKIIPFSITQEEAKRNFAAWWLKHEAMPQLDFVKYKITISDLYVPVWLINADVDATMAVEYKPYIVVTDTMGNINEMKKEYKLRFDAVPFDASVHIEDELFYKIEPYKYGGMIDFNPSFLAGHPAECYHNSVEDTVPRAIGRMRRLGRRETRELIDEEIRGGIIERELYSQVEVIPDSVTYALVPVWVVKFEFKGEKQYAYVNGQTGKVDGQVLFDSGKTKKIITSYGITYGLASLFGGLASGVLFNKVNEIISILKYNEFEENLPLSDTTFEGTILYILLAALLCFGMFKDIMAPKGGKYELSPDDKIKLKQKSIIGNTTNVIANSLLAIVFFLTFYLKSGITDGTFSFNLNLVLGFLAGVIFGGIGIYRYYTRLIVSERFVNETDYLDYINYKYVVDLSGRKIHAI